MYIKINWHWVHLSYANQSIIDCEISTSNNCMQFGWCRVENWLIKVLTHKMSICEPLCNTTRVEHMEHFKFEEFSDKSYSLK